MASTDFHFIPAADFGWDENFTGEPHTLTCINHQDLTWMTKHLHERNLHYVSAAPECDCPMHDLMVKVPGPALVKVGAKPAKPAIVGWDRV